jgi:hypothetical protein
MSTKFRYTYEKTSTCNLCGNVIDLNSDGWLEAEDGDYCADCVKAADDIRE